MNSRQILQGYQESVTAAPDLAAAVNILSDTAEGLGFAGASCVFWPRPKQSTEEMPAPAVRLSGSNLGETAAAWNANYIKDGLFKSDFVYRACLVTAIPLIWSYENLPYIVLGVNQKSTIREIQGIERMVKITGYRGGISVPVRGPGGFFGYVAFPSVDHLDKLSERYRDCSDHLLGLAYRFYHAIADKLTIHETGDQNLTPRQLECLKLLAMGKTLDETAEILGLSYSTVRFHLKNAEFKLGTMNRANAISKAAFLGMLGNID